jgi:hypothetical protein
MRNLEDGLFNGDYERQYKSTRQKFLSLWELCEGNLEGGLLYWEL